MYCAYTRHGRRFEALGAIGIIAMALLVCGGCASGAGRLAALGSGPRSLAGLLRRGDAAQAAENLPGQRQRNDSEGTIIPVAYQEETTNRSGSIASDEMPDLTSPASEATQAAASTVLGAWTFDDAVRATLSADPLLQAGMAAIQEAHADWWTSSLPPNPELEIEGGTLPFKTLTPDAPGGPPQLDISISMPIDWFLFAKRAAAMESARVGTEISEAQYADLIRTRVADTSVAFYDLLEAKSQRELARQDVEALSRLESVIERAQAAGGLPALDLKRVHLDLLQSRQALLEADRDLAVARANLWARFGRDEPLPDNFDIVGSLENLPKIEPLPIDEAFAQAQRNRPDIRALRLLVTQAGANRLVERRNAFPEVTPGFGYSHQYQERIGDPDFDGWNISLGVTVPVFDRNQGNRAKALAAENRSRWELQSGLIDLRAEVTAADQELRTAKQQIDAVADEQVHLAADVRDRIMEAYRAGGAPLIDVLNAESSYRETYRLYISSRADYGRALYLYNSALGVSSMERSE